MPGIPSQHELRMLVEAGLSPFHALESGTRSAGVFLGGDFGVVEQGRVGGLLLLDANPLEDIANVARVSGVMVRGTWLAQEEIRSRLATIEATRAGRQGVAQARRFVPACPIRRRMAKTAAPVS